MTAEKAWTSSGWALAACCSIQWLACGWRLVADPVYATPQLLPCAAGDESCEMMAGLESAADNCSNVAAAASAASLGRKYSCASAWAAAALLRVGGGGNAPQSHEERLALVAALALAAAVGVPYCLVRVSTLLHVLATAARPAARCGVTRRVADVSARDSDGYTALDWARLMGRHDAVGE